MFDNIFTNILGAGSTSLIGQIPADLCKIDLKGRIAVKTNDKKYRTYDFKNQRLIDTDGLALDFGSGMFFSIPTTKVSVGDVIFQGGSLKFVVEVAADGKYIMVQNPNNEVEEKIRPSRHVILGNTYFYGKVVSLFGGMLKGGDGFKNILQLSLFSAAFGGGSPFGGTAAAPTRGTDGFTRGAAPAAGNGGLNLNSLLPLMLFSNGSLGNLFGDFLGDLGGAFDGIADAAIADDKADAADDETESK